MNRILASISAIGLLAAATTAQCLNVASPGTLIGVGDDTTFTPHFALGLSFPVAGSALGNYTHFRLSPNGWLILTDGTTTPTGIPTGYGADATLAGTAVGNSPRVAPFWRDMNVVAPGGVFYDNTTNPGVSCKISWVNTRDYNVLPLKSYSAELFATGEIQFSYSNPMNVVQASSAWVGLSRGNGQTVPAQTDLSGGGASAGVGMVFQTFATGAFDLAGSTVSFTPDGTGGWNTAVICTSLPAASHSAYGTGCYTYAGPLTDSFHEFFATPALASAALQGNAMTLTPTLNGYTAAWVAGGATGYVAPTGGAVNVFAVAADDDDAVVTPTAPLTIPGGTTASINVMSNGIITLGAVAADAFDFSPTSLDFGADTLPAVYSWHDYNEAEVAPAASGRIKSEEVAGVLYITWDNVENYSTPAATNPGTIQFQLDLASGVITVLWVTVDTDGTSGFPTGIPHLVGLGGPATTAPAPIVLATGLPVTTFPQVTLSPLTLSASPAPTYTTGNPSVPITFTINNSIDIAAPFGIGLNLLIFSLAPIPGGLELGPLGFDIGAPGCFLNIASLDVIVTPSGTAPTSTVVLAVPQPLSPGLSFYSQAISLFAPNSLPNGQNAFGGIFSNGLQSFFNTY